MYVFIADKLYLEKQQRGKRDDEITVSIDDIMIGFENVKESKDKLNDAINETNKKVGEFIKKEEENLRLIQIAALALWADGKIVPKEKQLFIELTQQYKINISIDEPEKLPNIEEICSKIHTKSEKLQALDITCRMIAFDEEYPEEEKQFMQKLLDLLGYQKDEFNIVDRYIKELLTNYQTFESIASHFEISSHDALSELMKEYTEGAANYHLAEIYKNGSTRFGGIAADSEKAAFYFAEAIRLGFSPQN